MTTLLSSLRKLAPKKEKSGPTRQGQKVGLYDNEEPDSYSCFDSDDLHLQPKGCEGRRSSHF
jgi:hypothetical protein